MNPHFKKLLKIKSLTIHLLLNVTYLREM